MSKWIPLILICAGALVISFLLRPMEDELALLYFNDKEYEAAQDIYEHEVDVDEDPDQETIFPFVKLLLQNGETEKAIQALKKLILDEPQNREAHKFLVRVYQDTQQTHASIKALKDLYALKPDSSILRKIVHYSAFIQDEQEESQSLLKLIEAGDASDLEIRRLTILYLGQGRIEEAISLLTKRLPEPGDIKKYQSVFFLIDLLIQHGKKGEAQNLVTPYLTPKYMRNAIELVNLFLKYKLDAEALTLMERLMEENPTNPIAIQWKIDFFLNKKQNEKAFQFLETLATEGHLPAKLERSFMDLATSFKNPQFFQKAVKLVKLKALSHETLLNLGEYSLSKNLSKEAHHIRVKLGKKRLSQWPLLNALLKTAHGMTPLSSVSSQENDSSESIEIPPESSFPIDIKRKRQIAYMLLKYGNKEDALKLFLDLSQDQGPKSPDVQEVLTIWGGKLTPQALQWIVEQTLKASPQDKQEWLKNLLYKGYPHDVVRLMKKMSMTNEEGFTKIYIEALESTKDYKNLRKALFREMSKPSDVQTLIYLADLAAFAKSPSLRKKILKKLSLQAPEHPYVLTTKIETAMAAKRYSEAQIYLEKLLWKNPKDVTVLYTYAEVIRHQQGLEKARPYYEKNLSNIRNLKVKNADIDFITLKSLYFIGKKEDSIKKKQEILASHKKNKGLKANMAHFFMDRGDLKEAEAILNEG